MKNLTYYLLCISVFATVFILINATTATAVNINIITKNSTETVKLDLNQFLKRKLTTIENGKLKVDIGSLEQSQIKSALLYLCKNKNLTDCLKSLPIQYTSKVDTIFSQKDIEINGKSGLVSILKTNETWLADWAEIDNSVLQNSDMDEISVYSSVNLNDTKKFIQNYGMIPVSFIDNVDFGGKQIYQIVGSVQKKGLKETISISEPKFLADFVKQEGYIFAFPTDQKIYTPITFYNVPRVCGDSVCSIGENYQTCWYDCACPQGQIPGRTGCTKKTDTRLII